MQILHFNLKPIQADAVELRSFWQNPNDYEGRLLRLTELDQLIQQIEALYRVARSEADLTTIGRQLFQWLDGDNRWLVSKLTRFPTEEIGLAISMVGQLRQLPWELLHDGAQFLVQRQPAVVPIRWQSGEQLVTVSNPRFIL